MNSWLVSLTATAVAVVAAIPARPNAGLTQDAPATYTFHMDIGMAMRHFPWLHFRMEGTGDYARGDRYVVHLTKTPALFSKMHDIDLSMIDPGMWPKRYRAKLQSQRDGVTVYDLTAVNDPSMRAASVALGADGSARWVDAQYADGMHLHMTLTNSSVSGYVVPVSLDADVDYPHMPMSADASFSDYSFPTLSR
ncbi:MAG TPA: hypothetical protein VGK84_09410 [Candidatus Tumulicola sp.]|jgi:hypothetical protein